MLISPNQAAGAASSATHQNAVQGSQASSGLSSDFETFLKMLTVQARNQDPLEPIDSTEYAAQLAQFSMVEQQVKTNDALSAMLMHFGASQFSDYAGLVGMEARSTAPAQFTGAPIDLSVLPALGADEAVLVVRNAQGVEVDRKTLDPADLTAVWSGLGDDGKPLPDGSYSFALESMQNGKVIQTDPVESYTRVSEVQMLAGNPVLILASGDAISPFAITGLRSVS